jgi:hypothetical protein
MRFSKIALSVALGCCVGAAHASQHVTYAEYPVKVQPQLVRAQEAPLQAQDLNVSFRIKKFDRELLIFRCSSNY